MIAGSLAKRYARALIELAKTPIQRDEFAKHLDQFADACDIEFRDGETLSSILGTTRIPLSKRTAVADQVLRRIGAKPTMIRFIELVIERGRVNGVRQIARFYQILSDEQAGRMQASVTSATPMSPASVAALRQSLEKSTGKKIILTTSVDAELIGGIVTQVGSYTIDHSVKNTLSNLRQRLNSGAAL